MRLSNINESCPMSFSFENTKHKLGVRIWGDRQSFYERHEFLTDCWTCQGPDMSRAEYCSYIGIVSYFSYEELHVPCEEECLLCVSLQISWMLLATNGTWQYDDYMNIC